MLYRCPQGCSVDVGMSKSRPTTCEKHGSPYVYTKALGSNGRKPLRRVAEKREGEVRHRGSTLKRGKGFGCTPAQREKVKGLVCIGCGRESGDYLAIDPAHLWPKGKGGCDSPDCVGPLCREPNGEGCHKLFDEGKLELLPKLIDKGYWVEMAHPIAEHEVSPFTLTKRLTYDPSPQPPEAALVASEGAR